MDESGFQEVLEKALKSYSGSDPLAGLEERIVARVRGLPGSKKSQAWLWTWAFAGLTVILAVALLIFPRATPNHQVVSITVSKPAATQPAPIRVIRHPVRQPHDLVSKPTLSEEELLLLHFVEANPAEAAQAFSSARKFIDRDVTVEVPIIKPIELDSLQGKEEIHETKNRN